MNTKADRLVDQLRRLIPLLQEIVADAEATEVTPDSDALKRIETFADEGRCLICEEIKGGKYSRGCCSSCYNAAFHRIRKHEITEADLVSEGLWTPPGFVKTGRKAGSLDKLDELARRKALESGQLPVSKSSAEITETYADHADESYEELLAESLRQTDETSKKRAGKKIPAPKKKVKRKKGT